MRWPVQSIEFERKKQAERRSKIAKAVSPFRRQKSLSSSIGIFNITDQSDSGFVSNLSELPPKEKTDRRFGSRNAGLPDIGRT
mmetsp:Transcript_18422/g.22976  ORF Transcript_18422/g.22976 Transcript_18422/m.22976 type:complete len:83 (+) Transcript_18422:416-664(+)